MRFSRLMGAAITCGVMFSGGIAQAQVNYYTASALPRPNLLPTSSGDLPSSYPQTDPTMYSSDYGVGGSSASDLQAASSTKTAISGPAPLMRLPSSDLPAPMELTRHSTESVLTETKLTPAAPGGSEVGWYNENDITPITTADSSNNYWAGSCADGSGSAGLQPFATTGAGCGRASNWYGGAYGLVLTRDAQEHHTFSYDTGNEAIQYTDQKDADTGWGGGFATVVGRYVNCGQNAIEGVYWGWFPGQGSTFTFGANALVNINGIHNWSSLTYNGLNMNNFVDGAQVHALFHDSEAHNIELNLLSFSSGCSSSPFRYTLLGGVRYFQFRDHLTFQSDPNDTTFTGEVDEIFYDIKTANHLVGFQLGGVGTYCRGPRLSWNAGAKVGLFGNHISHSSVIGGPAGIAVINNGPNVGQAFSVDNSKNDVSMLTEVFLGAGYCVNSHLSFSAGYRAIAVTGLAMPTDQIYPDLRGINDLATVESPSSMILHGAYFGGQFLY